MFARFWRSPSRARVSQSKLHSLSLPHPSDRYFLSLGKWHLFINCHNHRISIQLVILLAEGKKHSQAVINFIFAIYKYLLWNLYIGENSC